MEFLEEQFFNDYKESVEPVKPQKAEASSMNCWGSMDWDKSALGDGPSLEDCEDFFRYLNDVTEEELCTVDCRNPTSQVKITEAEISETECQIALFSLEDEKQVASVATESGAGAVPESPSAENIAIVRVENMQMYPGRWDKESNRRCSTEDGRGASTEQITKSAHSHSNHMLHTSGESGESYAHTSSFLMSQNDHMRPHEDTYCTTSFIQPTMPMTLNLENRPSFSGVHDQCITRIPSVILHKRSSKGELNCENSPIQSLEFSKDFHLASNLGQQQKAQMGKNTQNSVYERTFTEYSYEYSHQINHPGEKSHQCTGCGKDISLESFLSEPQRFHTGDNPSHCAECKDRLHTQVLPHECEEGKNICDPSAQTPLQSINAVEKLHESTECKKPSVCISDLESDQRVLNGDKAYTCTECKRRFSQFHTLKEHQTICTGAKPYACTECRKTFRYLSNLLRHHRDHTRETPDHCTEYNSSSSSLGNHQNIHTGERPYECTKCKICFTKPSNLHAHQSIHTGEKPYQCPYCDKCFRQSKTLKEHQLTHTGERPYECSECKKCFQCFSKLKIHQRTHTGERPYECTECKKRFVQSFDMKKHQSIHTRKKPWKQIENES